MPYASNLLLLENPLSFILAPNPASLLKTATEVKLLSDSEHSAFYPEPSSPLERGFHMMCPVRMSHCLFTCTIAKHYYLDPAGCSFRTAVLETLHVSAQGKANRKHHFLPSPSPAFAFSLRPVVFIPQLYLYIVVSGYMFGVLEGLPFPLLMPCNL